MLVTAKSTALPLPPRKGDHWRVVRHERGHVELGVHPLRVAHWRPSLRPQVLL